jgi:phosphohistidine swiveling domain-containing protein
MHLIFESIARMGPLIEPISAPGFIDLTPVLKVYFGIFASAPVFLVSLAFYLFALSLAAASALIGVYFGIAVTRALIALVLVIVIGIIYALWKTAWLSPKLIALDRIGEGANFTRRYGAKAVNLGRLIRAGFNVPGGYALANATASSTNKLCKKLARQAGRRFDQELVIIRSSFAGEDSKHASYSGVFLSVKSAPSGDAKTLAEAIGRVSASKANAGIIDSPLAPGDGLSVVVQKQIEHHLAGFAFSVDVSTGRRECLLIEAQEGGCATYRIDRITGARLCIAGKPGTMDESLLDRIIDLTEKASDLFGAPTQIEWGWDGNKLWTYQARPILKIPVLDTWVVAPGLEATRALTPMSKSVLFGGTAINNSGGAAARLGLLSGVWHRDYEGRRFFDWTALESAKRKLRKGDLPCKTQFKLLRMFFRSKKRSPGLEVLTGADQTLKNLISGLHKQIRTQQDERLVIDALCVVGSFLCGQRISSNQIHDMYPLGEANPFMTLSHDLACLIQSEGSEAASKKFPFLTLNENELAATRSVDDPNIIDSFIIADSPLPGLDEKRGGALDALKHAQRDAFFRTLPFVASRIGKAVRRRRISTETSHLNILKINQAIGQYALKAAAESDIAAQDVFFFYAEELTGDAGDYPSAETILKRRRRYRELMSLDSRDVLHYRGDEQIRFDFAEDKSGLSRGIGIGQGVFPGRLVDPKDSGDAGAGQITLLPDTGVRWLGALRAGFPVLCQRGGICSHLANVAREIGVPIFVLTEASSQTFGVGDEVEIDFDRGTISRV